jgi:nicotinamide riboside kinase
MLMLKHFGLTRRPFELPPDSSFFYNAPAHVEALATIRYVARFGSRGVLTLGETGSGKSTLAIQAARELNTNHPILWLNGRGWSGGDSAAMWIERGALHSGDSAAGTRGLSLSECRSLSLQNRGSARIIIDNADALPSVLWTWVLSWIDTSFVTGSSGSWFAFGRPQLGEKLARPRWDELRHRLFRITTLQSLCVEQVEGYVAHRLTIAGRDANLPPLFTPEALQAIHQHSAGAPGVINQLCDNALVDAFGDDRHSIDSEHIERLLDPLGLTAAECARNQPALPASAPPELPLEMPMPSQPAARLLVAPEDVFAQLDGVRVDAQVTHSFGRSAERLQPPLQVRGRTDRARIAAVLDELERNAISRTEREARAYERTSRSGEPVVLEERPARGTSIVQVGVSRNISAGGFGLLVQRFVYPGTDCRVHIPGRNQPVAWVHGRIARCRYLSGTAALYEAGIEFLAHSPDAERAAAASRSGNRAMAKV